MVMNDSGARPSRSSSIMASTSPTAAASAAAAAAKPAANDSGEKNPARHVSTRRASAASLLLRAGAYSFASGSMALHYHFSALNYG